MIIVNFKKVVTGQKARDLIKKCLDLGVIPAVQDADWVEGCWTQKFFKSEIPCLLNHSDYRLDDETLKKQFTKLSCVCVASMAEGQKIKYLNPTYVLFEPPELIGSTEKSVSTENPQDIKKLADMFPNKLLVGAGIKSKADVQVALRMGAIGVGVSSAVVKANDPEEKIRELMII